MGPLGSRLSPVGMLPVVGPGSGTFSIAHFVSQGDTLAWATGTRVGAGDHAIALFCIGCGRVLGFLYSDTFILHFVVNCAH